MRHHRCPASIVVHYMPGRGWAYNVWSFGCVKLTLGRKIVRVGTDHGEGLAKMIGAKMVSAIWANDREQRARQARVPW